MSPHTHAPFNATLLVLSAATAAGVGCQEVGPEAVEAPTCATLAGESERELFTEAIVPVDAVRESLVFGGMDPGSLEPINFELGFMLNDINIDVTAPAELYVRALGRNEYLSGLRAGETDYQLVFDVCTDEDGAVLVEGDLAHITTIATELQPLFEARADECETHEAADESVRACRWFLNDEPAVIAAGTLLGTAGGTGATTYAPGLDVNLLDARAPNAFVNPERLGAEEGPGRAFRYGACAYEYFVEPFRSSYLAAVGLGGVPRESEDAPCGTLSVGQSGTAAGVWIREDKASLEVSDNLVEVLEHLLVLAPDQLDPAHRQVVSTELDELSAHDGVNRLMQFDVISDGDVNPSLYAMRPGTIYCLDTEAFDAWAGYYLELLDEGRRLKIERHADSCAGTASTLRTFGPTAIEFVR
ncbi:MAG: hypothetical protein IT383_15345 [Deltaproteobacteria bacterium]|nr:hypothetical protein [Deltaproteobacteria bacterium]